MYQSHFGLQEAPFALTPNTRYFLRAPSHSEALELLLVALREREGFIKVTGEVGTGKTLLCRLLLNELDKDACTAYVPNPGLPPETLYEAVAEELGVDVSRCANMHQVLKALNQRLIELAMEQRPAVLVIDEAQAMPEATIEALRLLTNLETESTRLLQVVLFGQPELDTMLAKDSLRQLRQRITFQTRLQPLSRDAVGQYLRHRLAQAGHNGADLFTAGALKVLWRASGGIPRLVNILAHKALLAAWGQGDRQVARKHVLQAVRDTESARAVGWLGGWL
ncbi:MULTISPECIES: ExeA family protein [Marinobacter]|jgi:MSHA biogenesis protein MshM|uniref:AAA family ATPase n=1 Tax=Marinobacter vinifirmus TaxID=355591 RepID=A0A7Z1IM10_9GAMM|nr:MULTISPECIES: AAA family ATPase [Marinobacter]KRW81755.1 AAA family ATPase [Marinobacter sp. P4B1]OZC35499.1 AAA family ATPase [Marinobacter vinifirmus]|tara:strand:- start:474 stop:1313 length:840 start_codon:yes stop_codon:yes gene_type:complete